MLSKQWKTLQLQEMIKACFSLTPFPHRLKAVNLTLQDPPGTVTLPASAYLRGKDAAYFDVRLLDPTGSIVNGLVDVTAVGY